MRPLLMAVLTAAVVVLAVLFLPAHRESHAPERPCFVNAQTVDSAACEGAVVPANHPFTIVFGGFEDARCEIPEPESIYTFARTASVIP